MLAVKLLRSDLLDGVSVLMATQHGSSRAGSARGAPAELISDERGTFGAPVAVACAALGARVSTCEPDAGEEAGIDAAVSDAVRAAGKIDLLVVDGAGLFARGLAPGGLTPGRHAPSGLAPSGLAPSGLAPSGLTPSGLTLSGHPPGERSPSGLAPSGHAALRACMDAAWNVTRAVVNHAFMPAAERGAGPSAEQSGGPSAAQPGGPSAEQSGGSSGARPKGRIVYLAPSPDAGEHAGAARAGLENLARTLSIEWARHGITTVTIAPGTATAAGEVAALVAYLASPAGAYFSGCLLDLRGV